MGKITEEMIKKAKTAKSAEELIALAKKAEIELNEEEAKIYFKQLNPESGELSDDELDDVSGGGCKNKGKTVVTNGCACFTGCYESNTYISPDGGSSFHYNDSNWWIREQWDVWCLGEPGVCGTCRWLEFNGGIGVCGKS